MPPFFKNVSSTGLMFRQWSLIVRKGEQISAMDAAAFEQPLLPSQLSRPCHIVKVNSPHSYSKYGVHRPSMPPHAPLAAGDDRTCHRSSSDKEYSCSSGSPRKKVRGVRISPLSTRRKHKAAGRPAPKSVSFQPMARARTTWHIKDFSDEEIENIWYDFEDVSWMKREARREAKLFESGLHPDCFSTRQCSEGLRVYTSEGSKRRSQYKRRAITIVLEEQATQKNKGSLDLDFIAKIYKEACAEALAEALGDSSSASRRRESRRVALDKSTRGGVVDVKEP